MTKKTKENLRLALRKDALESNFFALRCLLEREDVRTESKKYVLCLVRPIVIELNKSECYIKMLDEVLDTLAMDDEHDINIILFSPGVWTPMGQTDDNYDSTPE